MSPLFRITDVGRLRKDGSSGYCLEILRIGISEFEFGDKSWQGILGQNVKNHAG
jgi:hypothetical protein